MLVIYSVAFFDEMTPFPSLYALLPTMGALLLLLFASPANFTGRLLATKPLVGVGLISYSLYLWHQPLLAFARQRSLTALDSWMLLAVVMLAFPLAYLSWRWVEQPFRNRNWLSRRTVFLAALGGSLLFVVVGLWGVWAEGWPDRYEAAIVVENKSPRCKGKGFSEEAVCQLTEGGQPLTFLTGDSHAAVFAYEMQQEMNGRGEGLIHIYASGCLPVQYVYRADNPQQLNMSCYQFNQGLYDYIDQRPEIEYVVLAARWSLAMEGSRFDNGEGGVEPSPQRFSPHLDLVEAGVPQYHAEYPHREALAARFASSVQTLLAMGKR